MNRCFLTASLLISVSCGSNVTGPQLEAEISNRTDSFEFQATDVKNVTQTVDFNWLNSGTVASTNQASSIVSGSATLTLKDSQNNVVYQKNLGENGTFVSGTGVAGSWRVTIDLSKFSGTLNFRLEKRTP